MRPTRAVQPLGMLLALVALVGCTSSDEPETVPASATPSPSQSAPPSPEPSPTGTASPTTAVDAFTGLAAPWGVAVLPDGTALVSQRDNGQILHLTPGAAGWTSAVAGTVPGVVHNNEGGLLGLAVSPDASAVYAMFTANNDNRVVRMAWNGSVLGSPETILSGLAKASIHNGGRLVFGPDGMLYVATGDASNSANAQDPASRNGKILRIAADGSVPADNPFAGSPVYSMGHRNVQGLVFDDDGRLWASEFGNKDVDEVNLIVAGGNYGWPVVEGTGSEAGMINPVVEWSPTAVASPSGLTFAQGSLWVASLRGETLYQIPLNGEAASPPIAQFRGTYGRLRDVVVAPNGSLWLVTNNTDGRGNPRSGDDRIVEIALARS